MIGKEGKGKQKRLKKESKRKQKWLGKKVNENGND